MLLTGSYVEDRQKTIPQKIYIWYNTQVDENKEFDQNISQKLQMQTLSRADARINWWHSLEYGQYSMITSVQRDPKYETLSTSWNSCKPEMISIKTLFTVV